MRAFTKKLQNKEYIQNMIANLVGDITTIILGIVLGKIILMRLIG